MDLSQVRENIDRVDGEIRKLFMERMMLADNVASIKAQTEDKIYKPDREEEIILHQTQGVEKKLVKEYTALIKRIMEVSRKYQYGRTMELRDCFPFHYQLEKKEILHPAMIKEELYACTQFSKDLVKTEEDYSVIGAKIKDGTYDAGMGIIEEIGVGVSDELHNLLVRGNFYITECHVRQYNGIQQKVVTFIDTLVVLPEHNRTKIMFECPNRSGSISSILSMISDYGVNLTEIHSRPFWKNDTWNYQFFTEMNANIDNKEIKALLFQLSQETQNLKILGSYFCEDIM